MLRYFFLCLILIFGINAHAADYRAIDSTRLTYLIDGKPQVRLLFFFTSWCSVCKKNYSELLRLENKYKSDNIKIMAISLDEDMGRLKHFMRPYQNNDSTIYHLLFNNTGEVMGLFNKFGIRYSGAVPHVTLLDETGEIIADGSYDLSYFDKGLDQLLKKS